MILKSKDGERLMMTCNCHCGDSIAIDATCWDKDDDDPALFFSVITPKFYTEQGGFIRCVATKLKKIWYILANKDYCYHEIVLRRSDIAELRDYVNRLYRELQS